MFNLFKPKAKSEPKSSKTLLFEIFGSIFLNNKKMVAESGSLDQGTIASAKEVMLGRLDRHIDPLLDRLSLSLLEEMYDGDVPTHFTQEDIREIVEEVIRMSSDVILNNIIKL